MKKTFLTFLFFTGFLNCIRAQDFTNGMIASAPGATDKNGVYYYAGLDQKPDFPEAGGNFMQLIRDKVSTERFKGGPGIGLNIFVSFIIEKDGSVSNAQVINGHDATTVKEVTDAIKAIKTKWIPGKYKGKAVKTGMALTIFVPLHKSDMQKNQPVINDIQIVEYGPDDIDIPAPEIPTYENEPCNAATLQVKPEFPGGIDAFRTFVFDNIKKENLVAGTEGKELKVYVSFIVEKDGSLTKIQILRDPGYGLGKEVERILKSLKIKWSPGIQNGKPVRAYYTLPFVFRFPEEKITQEIKAGQESGDLVMAPSDEDIIGSDNTVYKDEMLDVKPEFPGGNGAFQNYVAKNIKKENLQADAIGITQSIDVIFVVEKDGSLTGIKLVKNDDSSGTWKEVLRVLKTSKIKWSPAKKNGKPVRSSHTTTVIFKIE